MDRTLTINGSDWILKLVGVEGDTVENFVLQRVEGQNFHATMVTNEVVQKDGSTRSFRQPLSIEHDQGKDKVGDVVLVFRQNPHTKRYMVQGESENVFEDENTRHQQLRATRASVDNIAQAVNKTVVHLHWGYSNPPRTGGKPIKTHYVLAGWSPQVAERMIDVYDYVQTLDMIGKSVFLDAMQHMPDRPARLIFNQMRSAPPNGENDVN